MKSLSAVLLSCAAAFAQMPSDAEIRKILMERVGSEAAGFGIVVGVIDSNGRRVVAYGSLAKNDPRRLDGRTVFEIGSMTKVFTSLLLMDMARRGEVALTDPVAKFLPASQSSRTQWPPDHAGRLGHAALRPARYAVELSSEGPRQSLRRL